MTDQPAAPPPEFAAMLRRRRVLARLALGWERLWPALWPALGLTGAYLVAALFGLLDLLGGPARLVLLLAVAAGVLALLWRGVRRLRLPGIGEADRRLERDSGLRHNPLATLADRPAAADPAALALWQAHQARARAAIARLRVSLPRPGLAAHDPRALRSALLLALLAGAVIAGPDALPRLAGAVWPRVPPGPAEAAPQLQAWITPPAHTGLAPIFLHPEGGDISVPTGAHLTVSVTGGNGQPALLLGGRSIPFTTLDRTSFQAEQVLETGGQVSVRRNGRQLAAWDITTIANSPPVVAFTEPPGRAQQSLQTRLPWSAHHQYGVTALAAELHLAERPDLPAETVPIPLAGTPRDAKGVAQPDLTADPWAGLPVTAQLVGREATGLTGRSDSASFTLPERNFRHPVAQAAIAVRKQLSLHPEQRGAAIDAIDLIARDTEAYANDAGVMVNLAAIAGLLRAERDPGAVPQAQQRLWELALQLDENGPARSERALEAARQALREALDRMARNEPADGKDKRNDKTELDRRFADLQRAIQDRLQELMEQARRDGNMMPPDPSMRQLNLRDMHKLQQELDQAAREGRTEDAQQRLAELEQMLDQLKNARPMTPAERQAQQQRQRGRQQMGAVQDMVQREGKLLDTTQGRAASAPPPVPQFIVPPGWPPGLALPPNFRRLTPPQSGIAPPDNPDDQGLQAQANTPEQQAQRQTDARTQRALRRALGELMQQYGDLTGKVPPPLSDADTAMRSAIEQLQGGHDAPAAAQEQKAIEALQKGSQDMGQQMAAQFGLQIGAGDQGEEDGDGQNEGDGMRGGGQRRADGRNGEPPLPGQEHNGQVDPLGRDVEQGAGGNTESGVQVPEQAELGSTRAIQDELRRRGADRTRPQPELDYIERLLRAY